MKGYEYEKYEMDIDIDHELNFTEIEPRACCTI
jgi:hypothetical protein